MLLGFLSHNSHHGRETKFGHMAGCVAVRASESRGQSKGGGDAVGLPSGLAAVGRVAGVVLQLGAGGGRDPPHALALARARLVQEQEVNGDQS